MESDKSSAKHLDEKETDTFKTPNIVSTMITKVYKAFMRLRSNKKKCKA